MRVFAVGGSVRDRLLGIPNSDLDYVVVGATDAEMISAGYSKVGADFPVYLHPTTKQEYALARTERKNGKGYLGFEVDASSTVTLEEDLQRRDFSINSIAQDIQTGEIIDPWGGINDLNDRVLRHTSPAFSDDPLRVIRLARFYARFTDFSIHPSTLDLAKQIVDSGEMEHLSKERFWSEMEKAVDQDADLTRFFYALLIMGVLEKVSFYADLFGTVYWNISTTWKRYATNLVNIETKNRLDVFVALLAGFDAPQSLTIIPLHVKRITAHMRLCRSIKLDETSIYSFLKGIRAFNSDGPLHEIFLAMNVAQMSGEIFPAHQVILSKSLTAALEVKAEKFTGVLGKELGIMIDNARIEKIKKVINEFSSG